MRFENTEKWQPVQNPDLTKRTPDEWAKIYGVKLTSQIAGWWNEYEWAYNFSTLKYTPFKKDDDGFPDWDGIADKEMRAQFIKRDIFLGADMGEKEVLNEKYMETNWIRNHILRV